MFSPYYAIARRLGRGDPHNHCAINVALYTRKAKHWSLTERTRADLRRDRNRLQIGPSRLDWDGEMLSIAVNEITVPFPSRLVGTIRVKPRALVNKAFGLDEAGRHTWHPLAPRAEIEVAMERLALRWTGHAYVDCNYGDEPLEAAFAEWDWSRAELGGTTAVLYDITPRRGAPLSLALCFDDQGQIKTFAPPPRASLPRTFWRVARQARSDAGQPRLIKTLEDTPFYTRSLVATTLLGAPSVGVHESLSLDRVASPAVRAMLPFRMPRRSRRRD